LLLEPSAACELVDVGTVYDAKRGKAFILAWTFGGCPCPREAVEAGKPDAAVGDETEEGAVEVSVAVVPLESTDILDSSEEPLPRALGDTTRRGAELFVVPVFCNAVFDVAPPKSNGTPVAV